MKKARFLRTGLLLYVCFDISNFQDNTQLRFDLWDQNKSKRS